jgi:molybdate transport system substrate-binding protein
MAVYGASSLKQVLPRIEEGPTYSFAGSDALARQIENGAPADLFAAASPKYPRQLAAQGRCARPVAFATNTLTLVVPAADPKVTSFSAFERLRGARIAIGDPAVPIGAYSREVLDRAGARNVLEENRVSSEQDVSGVVSKVALGSADAGLAYATDARAAGARVQAVAIPASAQPTVVYEACVVRRSGANTQGAASYLERLTGPEGRAALREAGFGPAPGP